ncbi:two-component system sensor histidine kinase VicK [Pullulanibacillus pueri]|uniref:histidine kinase n=1 Tax=Pullulanibacillus pueri TaxID=1437324 RepID=A0A8J2ZVL7_9BACL|nr:cell wall metabolism sensor histidine kinase WalK [Pullulanibacillus pueri]MBM7682193.1 two-component system sensor histidine kinase VicK [Pullulanibacillus pueri]GGH80394.1 PAS domain-containing sensor histidine kinase [Pullulanibacillus pueri]
MRMFGFFKSIQFKFVLIYTLLILLAMQLIGVDFSTSLEKSYIENKQDSMEKEANTLSYFISEAIKKAQETNKGDTKAISDAIQAQLADAGDDTSVKVFSKDRIILASNDNKTNEVGKQSNNPYVVKDLYTSNKTKPRILTKNNSRVMIVTTPIYINQGQDKFALLYMENSLNEIYKELRTTNNYLASAIVIALIVTALLGFFLARTITKPLAQMRRQARAVSEGDFSLRVDHNDDDEIGQLADSFNNMTDRLQEANATTEAERRRLHSVLTYMTDGVIATDRNGNIILLNDRSEELLHVYRQAILGKSIISLLNIEDEYHIDDLYEMQDSMMLDFSTEHQKLLIRVNFSVILKENGALDGLIAVLHDVTEQEQIDEERREFVANVSHELRTPLTTMRSYLEALSDGAVEDEELRDKFLGVTQNETERMIRLVNDLLQLSKLDADDSNFNKETTNYIAFLSDIIDRFEMAKTQNIEFVLKLPKGPIYTYLDRDKMTQVIDNIISNAIKYSPDGGRITFKVIQKGNHLVTGIKDEGVGIPKENLTKVFDRFFRVDKARSRKLGGTGLGLAIAKEIVAAHGGEIWADSEWNKGTAIFFTLPLSKGGNMDA